MLGASAVKAVPSDKQRVMRKIPEDGNNLCVALKQTVRRRQCKYIHQVPKRVRTHTTKVLN